MSKKKISLFLAIIVNINIVIGGGFFLSMQTLSPRAGVLAPFSWLVVGLLLFPLTLALATLAKDHSVSGGLFVYSHKKLGPIWGFISGWGYYIGTAAGNAAILLGFRRLSEALGIANHLFDAFGIRGLGADIFWIIFFTLLSFLNIQILGKAQSIITMLKTIPFAIVVIGAIFSFKTSNFISSAPINIPNFLGTLPIALFSYIGIEACCAIAHIIKDSKKNAARAILISFMVIVSIYTVIQFLLIGIHGTHSLDPFITILPKFINNPFIIKYGNLLIRTAILSSFLGGYYSMFFANNWNLYAIAEEDKIPFSKHLTKLNRYQGPWVAIVVQTLIVIAFLTITQSLTRLFIMSNFGVVIAYLLSSLSFLFAYKKKKYVTIGILALFGCGYFLYICFEDLLTQGMQYLIPYLLILGIGIVGYKIKTAMNKKALAK